MSENTGYEGHWPPRPVKDVKEGQVVQFPEPQTGRILTGTVKVVSYELVPLTQRGRARAALIQLESGTHTWAWVHELSEKENDERAS